MIVSDYPAGAACTGPGRFTLQLVRRDREMLRRAITDIDFELGQLMDFDEWLYLGSAPLLVEPA